MLLEPVQGEGGVWPAGAEYFQAVRRLCDERGSCSSWSTRSRPASAAPARWLGFQHYGIRPDVVTVAKALGNGVPIGACWARVGSGRRVRARRPRLDLRRPALGRVGGPGHAGGNGGPRTCPAGPRNAGAYLTKRLAALPGVRTVRGLGLLLGVELAGAGRPPGGRDLPRPRPGHQRGHPTAPCAWRHRCWSARPRSTRPSTSSAIAWREPPRDPSPSRRRRPVPGRAGLRARPGHGRDPPRVLAGRGVALVFQKPSARTRNSSEVAVFQLGGHPVTIRGDEVGIDTRESAEDIARTLAQYHAAIGARVFDHGVLERMAAVSGVPVINLLSDRSHPLQAIADLLTLRAHWGGHLAGHRVAWVGDGNNVARSFALACALTGVELALAIAARPWPGRSHPRRRGGPGAARSPRRSARRGGGRRGRGVHRRLGLHGPGGRAGGARGTPSRPTKWRRAHGPGRAGRRFSPLLARPSGGRGDRRGHRRAGQPRAGPRPPTGSGPCGAC